VIAAAAALAGAVVGGAASGLGTYLGNRALTHRSDVHAARGIARVYQGEFFSAGERLHAILDANQLEPPPLHIRFSLDASDRKILASETKPDDWVTLADAEGSLRAFDRAEDFAYKEARKRHQLSLQPFMRRVINENLLAVNDAIDALAPLSGTAEKP
jgi:hypothetical protein